MKYSLYFKQPEKYLERADEIIIDYNNYSLAPDYCVAYPEKMIIINYYQHERTEESDRKIIEYSKAFKNLVLKIDDLISTGEFCKDNNIKFYYSIPINSFYELKSLQDYGSEYAVLGSSMIFHMKELKKFNIKLRAFPTLAQDNIIPKRNGIYGSWIRPEDQEYYDNIYIFDFLFSTLDKEEISLKRERALFDIYHDGKWSGNLNLLFTNFNLNVDNQLLDSELGKTRSNCGHRCQSGINSCHYCESIIKFASSTLQKVINKENKN